VAEVLGSAGDFNHGYTYSGHPFAAAVALENIRILQEEHIVEHVRDVAHPYLWAKWQALAILPKENVKGQSRNGVSNQPHGRIHHADFHCGCLIHLHTGKGLLTESLIGEEQRLESERPFLSRWFN
jgi:hypothetical protein